VGGKQWLLQFCILCAGRCVICDKIVLSLSPGDFFLAGLPSVRINFLRRGKQFFALLEPLSAFKAQAGGRQNLKAAFSNGPAAVFTFTVTTQHHLVQTSSIAARQPC